MNRPSTQQQPTTTAVPSVSYEKFAPRSTSQVTRLGRIAALTAGPTIRAAEQHQQQQQQQQSEPTTSILSSPSKHYNQQRRNFFMTAMIPPPTSNNNDDNNTGTLEDLAVMEEKTDDTTTNNNNIKKKQQLIVVKETLQQTNTVIEQMTTQLKHTTSLRLALRASINIADDVSNRHADLIRHSGELSAAADRLQEEEAILTRHAEEIGMPLQHYDSVDRIGLLVGVLFKGKTVVRGLAKIKVDNDDFPDVLNDIDKAVDFFGTECGGKQALLLQQQQEEQQKRSGNKQQQQQPLQSGNVEYFRRALVLQEAALDLIKEAVAERITNTTTQIIAALTSASNSSNKNKSTKAIVVQADQLEASLIYTRFHGISSRSNRLLSLVRSRLHRGEAYHQLLQHCRSTYCAARESLLRSTVQAHMDKLKEQHGPVGMTRLASVFLIRLCTVETALYMDFFGEKKQQQPQQQQSGINKTEDVTKGSSNVAIADDYSFRKDTEYQAYLTSICSELHRTVRRSLVTMVDLDTLCQIVGVLREERSMATSSPTTIAAARAISSVIQDAQERLIFCATSALTKEVVKFKPSPEDLNYPDKLIKKNDTDVSSETTPALSSQDDDLIARELQRVYASWFPPMRTVLRILSKIFRVVETRVFEDMALQSVQSCTKCLKDAAKYILNNKGQIHADLFLVKHLLILREQLSPFDIELRSVERQLDFSDAGKAVARFLANRNRRLFSMSTENALLTLMREGVSVQESAVDSKRDLEDALRTACNDFIEHASTAVAADILDLAELYRVSDAMSLGENSQKIQADFVLKLLTQSAEREPETKVKEIVQQMSLYLDNPATQSILLKPVSRKITRAFDEIRKVVLQISSSSSGTSHGWDDEKITKFKEMTDSLEKTIKKATKASN